MIKSEVELAQLAIQDVLEKQARDALDNSAKRTKRGRVAKKEKNKNDESEEISEEELGEEVQVMIRGWKLWCYGKSFFGVNSCVLDMASAFVGWEYSKAKLYPENMKQCRYEVRRRDKIFS
jgi:hypothetical protein